MCVITPESWKQLMQFVKRVDPKTYGAFQREDRKAAARWNARYRSLKKKGGKAA